LTISPISSFVLKINPISDTYNDCSTKLSYSHTFKFFLLGIGEEKSRRGEEQARKEGKLSVMGT